MIVLNLVKLLSMNNFISTEIFHLKILKNNQARKWPVPSISIPKEVLRETLDTTIILHNVVSISFKVAKMWASNTPYPD